MAQLRNDVLTNLTADTPLPRRTTEPHTLCIRPVPRATRLTGNSQLSARDALRGLLMAALSATSAPAVGTVSRSPTPPSDLHRTRLLPSRFTRSTAIGATISRRPATATGTRLLRSSRSKLLIRNDLSVHIGMKGICKGFRDIASRGPFIGARETGRKGGVTGGMEVWGMETNRVQGIHEVSARKIFPFLSSLSPSLVHGPSM